MYYSINPQWWELLRGERFHCTQCGICCERPGFIYFHREEAALIARHLGMSLRGFLRKFGKKQEDGNGYEVRLVSEGMCPFYLKAEKTCGIHPVKFVQCRTYPFWPENVAGPDTWAETRRECEGIGQGPKVVKRDAWDSLEKSAQT
jgi:Fe-S-cluster containining protein